MKSLICALLLLVKMNGAYCAQMNIMPSVADSELSDGKDGLQQIQQLKLENSELAEFGLLKFASKKGWAWFHFVPEQPDEEYLVFENIYVESAWVYYRDPDGLWIQKKAGRFELREADSLKIPQQNIKLPTFLTQIFVYVSYQLGGHANFAIKQKSQVLSNWNFDLNVHMLIYGILLASAFIIGSFALIARIKTFYAFPPVLFSIQLVQTDLAGLIPVFFEFSNPQQIRIPVAVGLTGIFIFGVKFILDFVGSKVICWLGSINLDRFFSFYTMF